MRAKRRSAMRYKKRLLMICLALIVIVVCVLLSPFSRVRVTAGEKAEASVRYATYVVHTGDTLWGIADTYMDADYYNHQDFINEVMRANGLNSSSIYDGQLIIIPCSISSCTADTALETVDK